MDKPTPRTPAHPALQTTPDTAAAAPPPATAALAGARQVIELADGLSDVADRLHQRILDDIARHEDGNVPPALLATARALLDDEMLLRQRANTLYADAASHIIGNLGLPQARLTALTADAAGKIRRIGKIAETTSLVGSILALAGAAVSGQPVLVLEAIEKIRFHNAALDALAPPPA